MKKVFLLSTMVLFLGFTLNAAESNMFSYDKGKVSSEMTQLNQLEDYVMTNQGVTFDEMKASENPLVQNVSAVSGPLGFAYKDLPLGIPAWVWGFCLGWVGILIVYLVTDNKNETMNALYGCLAAGVIYVIFYVVYVVIIGATLWSTSGI